MKTALKLSAAIMLTMALAGCVAQKQAGKADKTSASCARHEMALRALEERCFIIEVSEFYMPGKKAPVKPAVSSYISLQGDRAVIRFAPDLSTRPSFDRLNITDHAAKLTEEQQKRNGDMQFCLKMDGGFNSQNRKVVITLFRDTNKCYVRVTNDLYGYSIADLTGYIYPKEN